MAVTRTGDKQSRFSEQRRVRNKSVKTRVKTSISKAQSLITSGQLQAAQEAVGVAVSSLDQAAEKKVIHSNNAARRKSRLMGKLNKALTSAPKAEADKKETK